MKPLRKLAGHYFLRKLGQVGGNSLQSEALCDRTTIPFQYSLQGKRRIHCSLRGSPGLALQLRGQALRDAEGLLGLLRQSYWHPTQASSPGRPYLRDSLHYGPECGSLWRSSSARTLHHAVHYTSKPKPTKWAPRGPSSSISCYRCGGPHLAPQCKYKEVTCNFCKKKGLVCKSKLRQVHRSMGTRSQTGRRITWPRSHHQNLRTRNSDCSSLATKVLNPTW